MVGTQPPSGGQLQGHVLWAWMFTKDDLGKLKSIGAHIGGTLTVSVGKEVKVVKHNAQSEPKLFGLLGGYEWEIGSFNTKPFIIVQPSSIPAKSPHHVQALNIPNLIGSYINDYADMITPSAERELENKLSAFEQQDSTQIVILTIPSLDGDPAATSTSTAGLLQLLLL